LERVEGPDYRVQLERNKKIIPANLIQKYFPANSEDFEVEADSTEPTDLGDVREDTPEASGPTESESGE